jgi:hypothetical protein
MLTPETRMLIQHWPAVEEIIQAEANLRRQLAELLMSLKDDLVKMDWWSDRWNFIGQSDEQVYIAHNAWRYEQTNYAIWIGIEGFGPSALFGKEASPQLYVWTRLGDKVIIAKLRQLFRGKKILGSVEEKNSSYIVKHFLPKILPNQSGDCEKLLCDRVVEFFSLYAKEEKAITEIVAGKLKPK